MQQQLRKNAGGTNTIFVTSKEEVGWRQDHRVYDIQELFRWLIDLSVIQLLKEKKSKKSDFIVTENYHIRLKEPTAKSLIEKIKLNMNLKATFKGRNATYQAILYGNIQTTLTLCLSRGNRKCVIIIVTKTAVIILVKHPH